MSEYVNEYECDETFNFFIIKYVLMISVIWYSVSFIFFFFISLYYKLYFDILNYDNINPIWKWNYAIILCYFNFNLW